MNKYWEFFGFNEIQEKHKEVQQQQQKKKNE